MKQDCVPVGTSFYTIEIPLERLPSVSEYGSRRKNPTVVLDYDTLADSDLISSKDVATWLGMKEETLATWRCRGGRKLIWKKIGRTIRYQVKDVREFIKHGTCNPAIFQEV